MKLKTAEEIVVEAPHSVDVLSRITESICCSHVRITAICGYESDGKAHVRIVTEDNERALAALRAGGFDVSTHTVMLGETSPHMAHPHLEGLYGEVEIENNYWCAATHSGEHALIVFSTKDNMRPISAHM